LRETPPRDTHIKRLSSFFHVPADVFIDRESDEEGDE